MTQATLIDDGRSEEELREAEYGGTPLPLIRQGLGALHRITGPRFKVLSFVEPGCGPAPFCRVVREVYPKAIRYACDVRDERAFAERNALAYWTIDFTTLSRKLDVSPKIRRIDLMATNPPFSLAFDWAELGIELASYVFLLLPDDWHKRTKARYERFAARLAHHVVAQLQIPGRIAFYGGSRTDRVSYSWWLLSKEKSAIAPGSDPMWRTFMLRMLPPACRRWQGCRPGEEQD